MPAIVGPVQINSVGGGSVNFGDSFYLSPKATGKTQGGSGGFNTGNFIVANNGLSATNTIDADVNDQNIAANQ
ncbi:MAG: spore germination protein [Bacillaceae bacterium]|nr:spore germination protein [Bacillaceae bacterium]